MGNGAHDQLYDWIELVTALREDYCGFGRGLCVPFSGGGYTPYSGQYAVFHEALATGLAEYIADAGYAAEVAHYKVCEDCNANAADELQSLEGLALIKSELRAGRPVIMGFNSNRAGNGPLPVGRARRDLAL